MHSFARHGRQLEFAAAGLVVERMLEDFQELVKRPEVNFGSCVVHKDPENARIAIIAKAGSPKVDAAMAEIAKVYSQCLYSDTTIRFSKGSLIGLLAEAYYREGSASVQHD